MDSLNLFIDGEHVPAEDSREFERANPVSGEVATRAAAASKADAIRAVDAAAAAFPEWAAVAPGQRRKLLIKASEALTARGDDIIAAMKAEIGATEAWARFNVMLAADMLLEAALEFGDRRPSSSMSPLCRNTT